MWNCTHFRHSTSSETQGQIVGTRESLNGRKNIYGTKKSKERREEPLGTMSYQTSSKRSPPIWLLIGARKLVFFCHQSETRTAATVWNWSGKTLSPGALLAVLFFSSCLIFPPVQTFPCPHYLPLGLRGWVKIQLGRQPTVSELDMGQNFPTSQVKVSRQKI